MEQIKNYFEIYADFFLACEIKGLGLYRVYEFAHNLKSLRVGPERVPLFLLLRTPI